VSSAALRELWNQVFASLAAGGWRVVVTISGHYAHGHELVLMEVAEDAIARHNLLVLALPPLALVDEEMLDHAGLWEVSLLLALRPELVDLRALGTGPLNVATSAVLGADPRGASSPSLGEKALALALERISGAVHELLEKGNPAPLYAFYQRRRSRYRSYVETYYRGSLEEAAQAWWQERVREDQKAVGERGSRSK
jgi:creatinine amidohydrolase